MIKDQVAIITGSASGIGLEIAKSFIEPVSYTHLTLPTNREV